ncbi:hypothetical protein D9611_012894 [Ephemerocybe angulata]|uniref:Integrase core domain-containing protein n=1 Tax=Ephemerocybe angulata TaxID=980116 RepID=A0A8H5BAT6_9AGAR|nr:hypothetical protein D9611_012894 [Tulosesus angulatus]
MSVGTIKNRRAELGLHGSRSKKQNLTNQEKTQLVLQTMEKDPTNGQGKATIHARIAWDLGVHLPRNFVSDTMHIYCPEGFEMRSPNTKKVYRIKKGPVGIHERWAGDGHDKLNSIGFPIWALIDDATGKWLGAWVVPNNRLGPVVAYLFLKKIEEYGGMPLQTSLDCGSETTVLFGIANALREFFSPDYPLDELQAVRYMRSIHNISVERSWGRMKIEWGNNAVNIYQTGIQEGKFDPESEDQVLLVRWLWPKMLQETLDDFCAFRNAAKMRKNHEKLGPSGCSRNDAFENYEAWGGQDLLQSVDVERIRELQSMLGGEDLIKFVPDEFAARAQAAYDMLGIQSLRMENVWAVFSALYPIVFPAMVL